MDLTHAITRHVTPKDYAQVRDIVESNPMMYGADITAYHSYIISRYLHQPKDELEQTTWCVEVGGVIEALAVQYWWTIMPVWSIASLFFRNHEGVNQFNAVKLGAVLSNAMCDFAEARGIKDFYYVVRDSGEKRKRMSLSVNKRFEERYDVIDLMSLPPGETPKHIAYRNMMGFVTGRHTKPVVFRQAHLKNEYRG